MFDEVFDLHFLRIHVTVQYRKTTFYFLSATDASDCLYTASQLLITFPTATTVGPHWGLRFHISNLYQHFLNLPSPGSQCCCNWFEVFHV